MSTSQQRLWSGRSLVRAFLLCTLVLAQIALGACRGPAELIIPRPTPGPTPRPTVKIDPCTLISAEEITAIVGVTVQHSEPSTEDPMARQNTCNYSTAAQNNRIIVNIFVEQPYTTVSPQHVVTMFDIGDPRRTRVEGIGERAYVLPLATPKKLSKNYVAVGHRICSSYERRLLAPKRESHEHANRAKAVPN